MTVEEYQKIIKETRLYPREMGLAYCGLGLTGEAGEVADKIKKLYRDTPEKLEKLRHHKVLSDDTPLIVNNLAKELGDVLWYIAAIAEELSLDLATIMEMNYDKLQKRVKTGTIQGSGDNREEV